MEERKNDSPGDKTRSDFSLELGMPGDIGIFGADRAIPRKIGTPKRSNFFLRGEPAGGGSKGARKGLDGGVKRSNELAAGEAAEPPRTED